MIFCLCLRFCLCLSLCWCWCLNLCLCWCLSLCWCWCLCWCLSWYWCWCLCWYLSLSLSLCWCLFLHFCMCLSLYQKSYYMEENIRKAVKFCVPFLPNQIINWGFLFVMCVRKNVVRPFWMILKHVSILRVIVFCIVCKLKLKIKTQIQNKNTSSKLNTNWKLKQKTKKTQYSLWSIHHQWIMEIKCAEQQNYKKIQTKRLKCQSDESWLFSVVIV